MRLVFQVIWFLVIFAVLFALVNFAIAASMDKPIVLGELGRRAGRFVFWLLVGTGVIVYMASNRGWLPGVRPLRGP